MRMKPPKVVRLVAVALPLLMLAVLAVTFAILACNSPIKAFPAPASCGTDLNTGNLSCSNSIMELWYYWSYGEIAEGFAVLLAITLMLPLLRKLPMGFRVTSKDLKFFGFFVAFCGGSAWVARAINTVISFPSSPYRYDYTPGSPMFLQLMAGIRMTLPALTSELWVTVLLLGICGFVLFRLEKGLTSALSDAIMMFAAPLILFQQLGLVAVAPLGLVDHIANFFKWYEGGIQPFSNWLALMLSLFLTALGVTRVRQVRNRRLAQ